MDVMPPAVLRVLNDLEILTEDENMALSKYYPMAIEMT